MTNKNGTVVPAAQELETFLPVDSVNGVTKWVLIYLSYTYTKRMIESINQSISQTNNQSIDSNEQIKCECERECIAYIWESVQI